MAIAEQREPSRWLRDLFSRVRPTKLESHPDQLPGGSVVALLQRYPARFWTEHSIYRAASAAEAQDLPLDAHLLLTAILAEANLSGETDSAAFLLRLLWSDRDKLVDPGQVLPAALKVARARFSLSFQTRVQAFALDTTELETILADADEIRRSASPRDDEIDTRHILAVLLRASAVESVLRENVVHLSDLRRALFDFIVRTHGDDVEREWRRVLLGRGFELRNLVSRDTWTRDDTLGYALYAQAIADSILEEMTQPPLTIGIQAPWGQGKTSLMRMIQGRLDPEATARDERPRDLLLDVQKSARTTYDDLLRWIRDWRTRSRRPRDAAAGMLDVPARRVPTVWFNPLYYQETAQVWAGMAHAILHQLAQQLPAGEREKFWLHLQLARVNPASVRRDVYQYILFRAVPSGLVVLFVIALLTAGELGRYVVEAIAGTSIGMLAGGLWGATRTIDTRLEKYVNEPDYQSHLGLLHLVDHDVDLALRLLVGTRPIAVFIDDLDRCDPQTVNQVILAINHFLSLPRRNVFFFLGMDMEMVAAALDQAQKETSAPAGVRRRSYGWRFMEKFVQLPFVIPHLDSTVARGFAVEHLRGSSAAAEASMTVADTLYSVKQVRHAEQLGDIAKRGMAADLTSAERAALQQAISKRATELMNDPESEEIERIVAVAMDDLELNPRTIKRYFALVRLLRNIQLSTGKVTEPDHDRTLVLRAAHLMMQWPQFVQWLHGTPLLVDRAQEWKPALAEVESIVTESDTHHRWCAELQRLFIGDAPPHLHDVSLYRFLRKITAVRPGLREMYDARLF